MKRYGSVNPAEIIAPAIVAMFVSTAVLTVDMKELLKLHNDMVKKQEYRLEEEQVKIQDKLQKYKNENFALYEGV